MPEQRAERCGHVLEYLVIGAYVALACLFAMIWWQPFWWATY